MAQSGALASAVGVDEYPDAAAERSGHRNLDGAQQRGVVPPDAARCTSGKLTSQVGRHGEDSADHVIGLQPVESDQLGEELAGCVGDQVR